MRKPHRRAAPLTDREESDIQRQIAADPDDFDATEDDLADARNFAEVFPALAESIKRSRGRPAGPEPKVPVTIRLDQSVVERFKSTGRGWQGRMNEALKRAKL